ncbi:MAG: ribose 5-phosphate isomerase B [Coriobacteriia bacterium]|nr:ribose 5-phosphate isomerase B [Coriobacteriia bacterium]
MKVAVASDHGGFEQKQEIVAYLKEAGHEVLDLGPADDGSVDYPDFALLVAQAVAQGAAEKGVLVCGTGLGMAITANKVAGIRAANVTSVEFATLAREHNDANVVTLSGRFVDPATNKEIVLAFLTTAFAQGRHERRVAKIHEAEAWRLPKGDYPQA